MYFISTLLYPRKVPTKPKTT